MKANRMAAFYIGASLLALLGSASFATASDTTANAVIQLRRGPNDGAVNLDCIKGITPEKETER
jgi:hypothetical protein